MRQMLLLPDPHPLVERLGVEFFRSAPECPGVYLMRDGAGAVLYVGKAKNLRKRLGSYRVANPDQMPRRHLKLVRAVERIELEECPDEASALARESELLRGLRPRFNRAGTWPGPQRFFGWRLTRRGLELAILNEEDPAWQIHGPFGSGVFSLRAALLRLLWRSVHPERSLVQMPEGWFKGRHSAVVTIEAEESGASLLVESASRLEHLFAGHPDAFERWVLERTASQTHPFELAVREADLLTTSRYGANTVRRAIPLSPPLQPGRMD
jgi:predicted GIY-YIG superfamily endonuclease